MPFDPETFAAEFVLDFIPSEEMPLRAQDALVAGFDGLALVRLAILEKPDRWEVDQLFPRVLAELGIASPDVKAAALLLATLRARRILDTREDPLPSFDYFHTLMLAASYPAELIQLGYANDLTYDGTDDDTRQVLREECENFLDPELAARRIEERKARHEELTALWKKRKADEQEERRQRLLDWPYIIDSPMGRKIFRQRLRETLRENIRLLWFVVPGLLLLVWATTWWKFALIYLAVLPLFIVVTGAWRIRRTMKRECQELRWRQRIDL